MYPSTQDNPGSRTQLFSVVGPAYIPEHRTDIDQPQDTLLKDTLLKDTLLKDTRLKDTPPKAHLAHQARPSEAAMAGLWLVFYVALIGVGVVSSGGATKLIHLATSLLP